MFKTDAELSRIESEVTRHVGCRIRFYLNGKHYLGRIEACQRDSNMNDIAIWVTPDDPAVSNPWPRLKLSPSNVVEIVDNIYGYQESSILRH